jgi:hypothetical protein
MRSLFTFTGGVALALVLAGCSEGSMVQPHVDVPATSEPSARPAFVFPGGCCFYEGRMVRTVVPPASTPKEGRDNFYAFPNGAAAGQKGIVAVAPGDRDYHGGHWAFHAVTFNVTPYLLTSETAVLAAAAAGDVSIARVAANDFRCPIQP